MLTLLDSRPKFMKDSRLKFIKDPRVWWHFLESTKVKGQIIFLLGMQCLMGGWWSQYSFRCQPVDYSNSPTAIRVSKFVFTSQETCSRRTTIDQRIIADDHLPAGLVPYFWIAEIDKFGHLGSLPLHW